MFICLCKICQSKILDLNSVKTVISFHSNSPSMYWWNITEIQLKGRWVGALFSLVLVEYIYVVLGHVYIKLFPAAPAWEWTAHRHTPPCLRPICLVWKHWRTGQRSYCNIKRSKVLTPLSLGSRGETGWHVQHLQIRLETFSVAKHKNCQWRVSF